MSIKVLGILELTNTKLPISEEIQLCFFVTKVATKNKIGIKLGGNIFSGFLKKFKTLSGKILFELIDGPMDVNAECLRK